MSSEHHASEHTCDKVDKAPKCERMCKHFKEDGVDRAYVAKAKAPVAVCGKCGRVSNDPSYLCKPVQF